MLSGVLERSLCLSHLWRSTVLQNKVGRTMLFLQVPSELHHYKCHAMIWTKELSFSMFYHTQATPRVLVLYPAPLTTINSVNLSFGIVYIYPSWFFTKIRWKMRVSIGMQCELIEWARRLCLLVTPSLFTIHGKLYVIALCALCRYYYMFSITTHCKLLI